MTASRRATLGCTAVKKMLTPSWSRSSMVSLNLGIDHGGDGGGAMETGGMKSI